ncbi:hypothetical protein D3C76_1768940 [compost metagenome]
MHHLHLGIPGQAFGGQGHGGVAEVHAQQTVAAFGQAQAQLAIGTGRLEDPPIALAR